MRITKIGGTCMKRGWRDLLVTGGQTDTDEGGWDESEFMESYGSEGIAGVIRKLGANGLTDGKPRPSRK